MSRIETHDNYDFPPGLGFAPRLGTNIHNYHQSSVTPLGEFPPVDRRGSLSIDYNSFAPMHSSVPRSIGAYDQEYGIFGTGDNWSASTNRQTVASSPVHLSPTSHRLRSPQGVPASVGSNIYNQLPYNDRDGRFIRNPTIPSPPSTQAFSSTQPAASSANPNSTNTRSTLHWGDLEPWMDEEWAKRVCGMMNWDPVNIKIPHPQPDPVTGQLANNPGYCFLTFPSRAYAERVMNQVNPSNGGPITMPNSSRPFNISWAASLPNTPVSSSLPSVGSLVPVAQQQYPKEYSIFVGDLAPETSNSDLVAVFRNPVLGLRNDREPKFIRPFLSCKSAKIMLDPITGVSRGYGFVRFTDETDQQRALIEMHGLYCLSRPMRISPATAKFKPPPNGSSVDIPQGQVLPPTNVNGQELQSTTIPVPLPNNNSSVSAPIAATNSSGSNSSISNPVSSSGSGSSFGASSSIPSLSSSATTSISSALASATSEEILKLPPNVLSQLAQYANVNNTNSSTGTDFSQLSQQQQQQQQNSEDGQKYGVSEESWKHHVQARAILGNLIGPNGEQLTSTDPYNTTVFVGGLSPLIGEDTLRSFFAPFGEIHYVKVPVGKHCGFVQFVRKADAERAIEQMQGFPIGGSRIRLSWGRSQYKAAQAAAQAAQSSALQAQFQQQQVAPTPVAQPQISPEQAIQLLQRLGLGGILEGQGIAIPEVRSSEHSTNSFGDGNTSGGFDRDEKPRYTSGMMEPRQNRLQKESNFSPFSPDPNLYEKFQTHPHSRSYSGFGSSPLHSNDSKAVGGPNGNSEKTSTTSLRPTLISQRFGSSYLDESRRQEAPISRPKSGTPPNGNGQAVQQDRKEHNAISDFNGTLASLDLDSQAMWKSSGGDVYTQYKTATSNDGTPSP